MSAGEILAAVTTILVFILTVLTGLIAYIFRDLRADVSEIKVEARAADVKADERIDTLDRHFTSMLKSWNDLGWRTGDIEEWLAENDGYKPLKPPHT